LNPDREMKIDRRKALLYGVGVLLGVFVDFFCNGVTKITFPIIYLPIYLGIAATLDNGLAKSFGLRAARMAALSFLIGAFLGHCILTGRQHFDRYEMRLEREDPLTLRSDAWPLRLLLTGDHVRQAIAAQNGAAAVLVRVVTDYGCIRTIRVSSVAGVDVENDPDITWTWRSEMKGDKSGIEAGPGAVDRGPFWCRIKFF
jgi:hypothetical protein